MSTLDIVFSLIQRAPGVSAIDDQLAAFMGLTLNALWVALAGFVAVAILSGVWLWPEREQRSI